MEKLFKSMKDGEDWFNKCFGKDETFDAMARSIHLWDMPALLLYINGLVDGDSLLSLLTEMQGKDGWDGEIRDDSERFLTFFPYHSVEAVKDQDDMLTSILSGQAAFITPSGYAFVIDVRSYPGRQPEEPDTEKVIRGARDGFTENIITNTALVRRRLRTEDLRFQMHRTTVNGKTDVAIAFIQGAASEEHLAYIRERLDKIVHDGLTMTDKSLEEFLFKQRFHPMPFVRFTERPDICAAHLLEGHIAIMVDTSPSVILVPVSLFHHLQHAEEYRQAPLIGTFVRLIRFVGAGLSLVLLPFWYLLATKQHYLPDYLSYIGPNDIGEIPLLIQILMADIGIEVLRMAAIHTPTPMSTAMGLVAAIVIGQVAIDVGLFTPEVVLYVAVSAIFTFAIPSFELSITTKVFRICILLSTAILGAPGFFMSVAVLFYYLCSLKPMGVPYLWPAVPFFPRAMMRVLIRFPMTADAPRPYITDAPERDRIK
ncbi:spore germination protein [Sporosarcina sp. Marseille-Q4063]|uniref:spore germination protein n=1 Tax=Sporosarcina sp. Marseille-Q4063 TaxID=2810514 RepID=UPI001BB06F97|nr:spore germination protein [Sporosarcina sp. Marseille-Q4063]QUW22075.1 spore germination protein [Sporosarcina sp. Marseille-Q4063]